MSKPAALHGTDEELMLLLDGEICSRLGSRMAARVREHLGDCAECHERLARIEATLSQATPPGLPAMDASGPRALMRARLAELARDEVNAQRGGKLARPGLMRGLAFACALALLAVTGFAVLRHESARQTSLDARLLPDPAFTPGATRAVALEELCKADSDDVVRSVPAPLQQKVFAEYGMAHAPSAEFEVDYLITPGLGGADDVRNLWPEPHSNTWNSYVKDQLEDRLHRMVCNREIPLGEAQRAIAGNWIAAYKKYFHTEQPLSTSAKAGQFVALRRKQRWS
jgi:anti-sigma factor RsiW